MKKIIYLLMSLSLVVFASCSDDDKDSPSSENGENGSNSGNGNVSAVSVFKSGTQDGHDYVDLGLTSGTQWATANVGASKAQDYGNYYAWGEVTTKEVYNWKTYKYGTYNYDKDYSNLIKYNLSDNKTTLDPADDAAHVNWGGKWVVPADKDFEELLAECYWQWTDNYNNSNVEGYIVYKAKSSSDKGVKIYEYETPSSSYKLSDAHIFLPAAGYCERGVLISNGSGGYYWSSSLDTGNPSCAWFVSFNSGSMYDFYASRYFGHSVRAVIPGE